MIRYTIKRILLMIPVIICVAIVIFAIMYFAPGDAVRLMLGSGATQEQVTALQDSLGLNDPFIVQLWDFLKQTFLHFDLGTSWLNGTSVTKELITRLPRTLKLALICFVTQIVIAIPLGVTAAVHRNKWQDVLCTVVVLAGLSLPGFWLALMMILLFSFNLGWLPSYGIGTWMHWIMPGISASLMGIGVIARQTRSQMLEVIHSDYIVTARAKGVSERVIRYKHALPNALVPVVTGIGTSFGASLGGSVVIESAFSIPGVGKYLVDAISNRDLPVVRGGVVFLAILFCIVILIVDLVYAFIDPRIKSQYEGQQKKRKKKNAEKKVSASA